MQIKSLSARLSVTSQIALAEMTEIAAAGFKSIICNRPDGESSDQPAFADIEAAALRAGLLARYIPVIPGQASPQHVTDFQAAIAEVPGPVLAYCRSGARSTMLWQMSQLAGNHAAPNPNV